MAEHKNAAPRGAAGNESPSKRGTRQTRSRSAPVDEPAAPARKPRAPRGAKAALEAPAPVVPLVGPDEAATILAAAQQAGAQLAAVRDQRDELVATLEQAERRAAELRRQAGEVPDLSTFEGSLALFREKIDRAKEEAEAADAAVRAVRERADLMRREADRARARLDDTRQDFSSLDAEARQTLDHLRATLEQARTVTPPASAERTEPARRHERNGGASPHELQRIDPLPRNEVADDARDRLVQFLNDAAAVEREQAGLTQGIIDSTDDADLRAAFEAYRESAADHREAVAARVQALGGEPGGGRSLLGSIVTKLWDALQRPQDGGSDPVGDVLKAISAAEFEAGMYLAVQSMALALNDRDTATMALTHYTQERAFAERLRARVAAVAVRTVRKAS